LRLRSGPATDSISEMLRSEETGGGVVEEEEEAESSVGERSVAGRVDWSTGPRQADGGRLSSRVPGGWTGS